MTSTISFVLSCLLHYFIIATANDKGNYIMLVPTVIYENSYVAIAVATMNYENEEQFQVKLERLSDKDGKTEIANAISNQRSDTVLLQFQTQTLKDGPHQLSVSGPGEIAHDIEIKIMKRPVMILIQTDKPIYKPGDTIKFRVLVLDHETRPLKNLKSVKVQLRDSKGNLIREWPYASLQQGVFQSQLDLANFIPLGDWTLSVFALNNEEKKISINIAEYVLPRHEIQITSPKRITFKDSFLELIVDASYTFGKPITGIMSITFNETEYPYKLKINRRSVIRVALKDVVNLDYPDNIYWLKVNVKIQESGSEHIYEANENIPIYKRSYKVELLKSSEYLLPEEPFMCWLTFTDLDGIPLANPGSVNVKSIRTENLSKTHYVINKIPDTKGVVHLKFAPSENTNRLELEVEYDGEVTKFQIISETDVDDEQRPFFQASILDGQPKLNQSVEALVQSSYRMNLVLYHVISQGEIMASGRQDVENKRSVKFAFKANSAMIPVATLAVFTIHDGRLWTSVVRFEVHDLNNNVDVKLSTNSTEPGDKIGVTVRSQPGSMVGLLAIDKGMLQLGSGNDITKQLVLKELEAPRAKEKDEFETLGFKVLTNAQQKVKYNAFEPDLRFDDDDDLMLHLTNYGSNPNILRKKFPETWLWTAMAPVGATGSLKIDEIVPDTITGWSISAFSINEATGLGVIDYPVSLSVLKTFFVTVNLAYSIVKTETAIVEVFVHNYLDQDQDATVQLLNGQGDFQFVDEKNDTNSHSEQSQQVHVPSNSVSKVKFVLKPTRSGNLIITVAAEGEVAKDVVQHNLRVTPGGLLHVKNEARYMEVEQSSMNFSNIRMIIPKTVTSGSENITFSAEGILLGAALTNLEQLIRLPLGCGEQNMVNLVPSVLALEYMSKTGTLRETFKYKAIDYLQRGYQTQLKYKLDDGSFSIFGQSDVQGSVFLTALTARTFRFAEKYIDIDNNVIKKAFNWLQSNQQSDGRFDESGIVFYKDLQSGLKDGPTLTAYILIAFLEHKTLAVQYKSVVEKGVNYISGQESSLTSSYDLSLVSYALHLANHPRKDYFFDKLVEKSQSDGGLRWWDSAPTSIETTAYALLTHMSRGTYIDAKSIMKWLVSQRYDKGGYDNTQNTFVGLQALAQYSERMSVSRNDYRITVAYEGGRHQLHMDRESSLYGAQLTLPSNVRSVDVTVQGTGAGVFQIAYRYNVVAKDSEPRFKITTTIKHHYIGVILNICTSFQPKRQYERTNMVMMEVSLPSGYVAAEGTQEIRENEEKVRKIETNDGNTHVILYLDPLLAAELVCVDLKANVVATVLDQVAGWIKVYDYYDPTREALEYFVLPAVEMNVDNDFDEYDF